jgi:autotransporter-associated beta strand protein
MKKSSHTSFQTVINRNFIFAAFLAIVFCCQTATNEISAQRKMENLGRGMIVLNEGSGKAYVGWRLLGTDPADISFNLYKSVNGAAATKIAGPLVSTTDYVDNSLNATATNSYYIRPIIKGVEQAASAAFVLTTNTPIRRYLAIPQQIEPDGGVYTSWQVHVGDVDGDGEYEYICLRTYAGTTAPLTRSTKIDCYKLNGTLLWRMDLGPNFTYTANGSGSLAVADFNGDGKAEIGLRTFEGTCFQYGSADSTRIGDTNGDGKTDYRLADGTVNSGPEFISFLEGATGKELARTPFQPSTNNDAAATFGVNERPLYIYLAVAWLDGVLPSLVSVRGAGGDNTPAFAFDFRNGAITERWRWVPTAGQGLFQGHNILVYDLDNDGKDEIEFMGSALDDNGTVLYSNTDFTHGDHFRVLDMDPDRPGYEIYSIQQNNNGLLGQSIIDGATGQFIKKQYLPEFGDVSRGDVGDYIASSKGAEFYSTMSGVFNLKGDKITDTKPFPVWGIWWDGDLQRELINGVNGSGTAPAIDKWPSSRLFSIYSDNGNTDMPYGGHPQFWGDILGDWREEIIVEKTDRSELRIYSSWDPAINRLYTLMQNPGYKTEVSCKGRIGGAFPDYYLGGGMQTPPPPPITKAKLHWKGTSGNVWDNTATNWDNNSVSTAFTANDSVLFDLTGNNASPILISGTIAPACVTVYSPINYTFGGTGKITGTCPLTKVGKGTLTLNNKNSYSGNTTVWDGALIVNDSLSNSPVTVYGGTWGGPLSNGLTGGRIGGKGTYIQNVTIEYGGAVVPGTGVGNADTITFNSLTEKLNAVNYIDLSDDPTGIIKKNDLIRINGNLILNDTITVSINLLNQKVTAGDYKLFTYTGTFTGSLSKIKVLGLSEYPFSLSNSNNSIMLKVKGMRATANVVWSGSGESWDLATNSNWLRDGLSDVFVPGDSVIFDGIGKTNSDYIPPTLLGEVTDPSSSGSYISTLTTPIGTSLPVKGVRVETSKANFKFTGPGSITGPGGLIKNGNGKLTILTQNGYSGKTIVNGGSLEIGYLDDAGLKSSVGSTTSTDPSYLSLNNSTLHYAALPGIYTNRGITLGGTNDTIAIDTALITIRGLIAGSGRLIKTGAGSLTLQQQTNTFTGGVEVKEGTLIMGDDTANRYGMGPQTTNVTLSGGTLSLFSSDSYNSTYFNLIVPQGATSRYNVDYRSDNYGTLTGGGILNMYIPYVRTTLYGDWSGFTGQLNLLFDSQGKGTTAGDFRINNSKGYAKSSINIRDSRINVYHVTTGTAVSIGELTGVAGSELSGANWTIGAKNTDTTFNGKIRSNALTKVGTGTFTVTDTCFYTSSTIVNAGSISLGNKACLKGGATVNLGATLSGSGTINGATTINGVLEGKLHFGNNLILNSSSTTNLSVSGFGQGQHDSISVSGVLTRGGTLNINVTASAPELGTKIKTVYTGSSAGSFSTVNCPGYSFDSSTGILTYTGHHLSGINNYSATTIPDNADLTVDNGLLTIDKAGALSNLVLMPGSKVSLNSGRNLPSTKIQIKSDNTSTATYVNGNTNGQIVSATVQQYLSSGRNWYISIPVTGVDSSALSTSAKAIIMYDEPSATWKSPTTATLTPMKGYIAVVTKANGPVSFSGTLNDGNQTVSLTRTHGVIKSGFNLIGNPYPSYLNWDAAEKSNMESTIWYRTKNASNTAYVFDTYNSTSQLGTSNNGEQINCHIPPMQAFWVRVKTPVLAHDTLGTLTFRNSMRSHKESQTVGVTIPDINFKVPAIQNLNQKVLRLVVSNDVNSDEAIILFNAYASNGIDAYDSYKMSNSNAAQPEIYTNSGSEKMVINGLNSIESVNYSIPLGFTTGETNTFSIKATEVSNFDSLRVYLKDNLLNKETELTDATNYSFTSDATSSSNRFNVIFKTVGVVTGNSSTNEQSIEINKNRNNQITVNCKDNISNDSFIFVYNALGQKLITKEITDSHIVIGYYLKPGMYIVTANNGNNGTTKKVIID